MRGLVKNKLRLQMLAAGAGGWGWRLERAARASGGAEV